MGLSLSNDFHFLTECYFIILSNKKKLYSSPNCGRFESLQDVNKSLLSEDILLLLAESLDLLSLDPEKISGLDTDYIEPFRVFKTATELFHFEENNENSSKSLFIKIINDLRDKISSYILVLEKDIEEYEDLIFIDNIDVNESHVNDGLNLFYEQWLEDPYKSGKNKSEINILIERYLKLESIKNNKIFLWNRIKFHHIKLMNCNRFLNDTIHFQMNENDYEEQKEDNGSEVGEVIFDTFFNKDN